MVCGKSIERIAMKLKSFDKLFVKHFRVRLGEIKMFFTLLYVLIASGSSNRLRISILIESFVTCSLIFAFISMLSN